MWQGNNSPSNAVGPPGWAADQEAFFVPPSIQVVPVAVDTQEELEEAAMELEAYAQAGYDNKVFILLFRFTVPKNIYFPSILWFYNDCANFFFLFFFSAETWEHS